MNDYEYKVTWAEYTDPYASIIDRESFQNEAEVPQPVKPEGERWRLVACVATKRLIVWTWERVW